MEMLAENGGGEYIWLDLLALIGIASRQRERFNIIMII